MSKINWNLDAAHSEVSFKVKHMMITNVTGQIKEFSVEASSEDEDFSKASVSFTAKAASINTNAEQRDTHLQSAEFFDVKNIRTLLLKVRSLKNKTGMIIS